MQCPTCDNDEAALEHARAQQSAREAEHAAYRAKVAARCVAAERVIERRSTEVVDSRPWLSALRDARQALAAEHPTKET